MFKKVDEMHQNLQQQQPTLGNPKGSILLYDNIRPHTSMIAPQKFNELGYETLWSSTILTRSFANGLLLFQSSQSLREKYLKNEDDVKYIFNNFIATRSSDFYATDK